VDREIRLSKSAARNLDSILAFLEKKWSLKTKQTFILKLDHSLKLIQSHPDIYPESESITGLRKCVVTKQTTLFYKYSETTIYIISVFDTRQNPETLLKETTNLQ